MYVINIHALKEFVVYYGVTRLLWSIWIVILYYRYLSDVLYLNCAFYFYKYICSWYKCNTRATPPHKGPTHKINTIHLIGRLDVNLSCFRRMCTVSFYAVRCGIILWCHASSYAVFSCLYVVVDYTLWMLMHKLKAKVWGYLHGQYNVSQSSSFTHSVMASHC